MLLNYLKLSLRLMARNPFFTFINIAGLSVGFSVFFVLWQYSQSELKSDRMWKDWDRIKRLTWHYKYQEQEGKLGGFHPFISENLSQTFPELSEFVRICPQNNFRVFFTGDHDKEIFLSRHLADGQRISFVEQKLAYADPNLFTFFSIPLVLGQAESILKQPSSVVLSEKLSKKYFGNENPLGMMLLINDSIPLTVTGVFKNLPANSHLDYEAVLSVNRIEKNINTIDFTKDAWFRTYFKLPSNFNSTSLEDRMYEAAKALCAKEYEKWEWQSAVIKPVLQSIEEVPFTMLRGDSFKVKSKSTLQLFQWIAIMVLVLAWINYINLSLALHKKRMKEIAARLTLGAQTRQFITQFVTEACVINIMAILTAFTLFQMLKDPIQFLFDFSPGGNETDPSSFLWIGVIVIGGIAVSGLYPALIALNRSPKSLFSSLKLTTSENSVARFLTVTQFVIAISLAAWMFSINTQVKYILNKDLGISKDQVIVIDLPYSKPSTFLSDLNYFDEALLTIPGVINYATSTSVAGDKDPNGIGLKKSPGSALIGVATNGGVDERFIPFYEIKILAGRNFLPENKADENSIILSRRALDRVGYTVEEAIGQRILVERAAWTHDMQWATITGIIEDYNHQPLLKGFQGYWNNDLGIALTYGSKVDEENVPKKVSVRIEGTDFDETISGIRKVYEVAFHGNLFSWAFLDDNVNRHYENEKTAGNQIFLFTCLAISIACLGLFGMISNKVVEKTKEIGIRKVLGAKLRQIASVLLNTTIKQVLIATVIGIPIAWYLTEQYLQRFSERIALDWWHFALPVLILVLIMLCTVAAVVWKAAKTNPVESLRYE